MFFNGFSRCSFSRNLQWKKLLVGWTSLCHFDTKNGEEEMEKHPACYDTLCLNQIPTYLDHIPEGTSTRPFVHYAQLYMSGEYDNWVFQRKELNFPIMSKEHSFAVIKACRQIWVLRLRLRKYGSLWPRFADNLWFVQGFICHFLQCHPDEWIVTGDCTNSNFQRGRWWFSGRARHRQIGENCLLF